jgi:ABC-type hemin transport system substrate-binding protein
VARRLGLSKAPTPEKVEADLCRIFPREDWIELHHQLIFHGRRVCDARRPDCAACPLLDLCPTGRGKQKDPHLGLRFKAPDPAPRPLDPGLEAAPAEGPRRLVSLVPSVTELLVQWGLAARLVGRTRYCIEPKWIRNTVPAVGGTKDPDLDRIRDLAPDLVILEKDENPKSAAEALTTLGIPWLALEVRTLKGAAEELRRLGRAVGASAAAEARATALEARLKGRRRKGPRTLVLIWREPWMAAGPDTYLGDLVRVAGLTPVGPDGYATLGEADLAALHPEIVILPTEPYRFHRRHAAELQARLPEAAIHLVNGQTLTWYLSRTLEGLDLLEGLKG